MEPPFPDTIKIGAFRYKVVFTPKEDLTDPEVDELFGRITYAKSLIEIRADLEFQQAVETFTHEILHAILIQMGNPPNTGEGTVDGIAYGFSSVLSENPEYARLFRDWDLL